MRESYFDENGRKEELINERVESIVSKANELSEERGGYESFVRGRARDARLEFDPVAESELSRAVKLRPNDVDAWNALGDVFWKKKDRASAADCYRRANDARNNAVSFRSLSLLERTDLDESVSLARKAVHLDASHHESWYVLGNALVARRFDATSRDESRRRKDLDDALKAYGLAEKRLLDAEQRSPPFQHSSLIFGHPDLHFNRGHLLAYLLDYPRAIEDFEKAHRLDPTLRAQETADDLKRFVKRCEDLVVRKGGLKPKKRQLFLDKLDLRNDEEDTTTLEVVVALEMRRNARPPDVLLVLSKTHVECFALAIYDADTTQLTPGKACTIKVKNGEEFGSLDVDGNVPLLKANRHDDVILASTKHPLPKALRTQALCAAPVTHTTTSA